MTNLFADAADRLKSALLVACNALGDSTSVLVDPSQCAEELQLDGNAFVELLAQLVSNGEVLVTEVGREDGRIAMSVSSLQS